MSDTQTAQTAAPTNGERPPPPMFYKRPTPLLTATHRGFKIRPEQDFSFAAKANAVPVTLMEFVLAARHYPILFVTENMIPTIALGFKAQSNLFVNEAGAWETGIYVPAYVRRYPFILLGAPGDEAMHLGVDDEAHSAKDGARALFEGEKETQTVRDAVGMCEQFHGAFLETQQYANALKNSGFVEPRSLEVQLAGETMNVGTFGVINEAKFREMPDDMLKEWWKRGWLHASFFHLQSMNNWEVLMNRAAKPFMTATKTA